jgi:hypothetical protein
MMRRLRSSVERLWRSRSAGAITNSADRTLDHEGSTHEDTCQRARERRAISGGTQGNNWRRGFRHFGSTGRLVSRSCLRAVGLAFVTSREEIDQGAHGESQTERRLGRCEPWSSNQGNMDQVGIHSPGSTMMQPASLSRDNETN